jgi:hypothetical protein
LWERRRDLENTQICKNYPDLIIKVWSEERGDG